MIVIAAREGRREVDGPFDDPCGENGTCVDGLDTFLCQCDAGFDGVPCTKINGKCLNAFIAELHTKTYMYTQQMCSR